MSPPPLHLTACLALTLASAAASSTARADFYSWGGRSGRLEVSVWLYGFNEGAGAGGWDEDSARDFATWAARFGAIVPSDGSVAMIRDISDDDTRLLLRHGRRVHVVTMPGGPDFAAALPIVAGEYGAAVPRPGAPARLFTVQVLAARSEQGANGFARALDERGVRPEGSFFHQECHPCFGHEAHVLDAGPDGLHRVVLGVFDRRGAAKRASAGLRRSWGLDGFVREL